MCNELCKKCQWYKSSLNIFLKQCSEGHKDLIHCSPDIQEEEDQCYIAKVNIFLKRWESLQNELLRNSNCCRNYYTSSKKNIFLKKCRSRLDRKMVRESCCYQVLFNVNSNIFDHKWNIFFKDFVRESICLQEFLKTNHPSSDFWKNWNKLFKEFVRESLCAQEFCDKQYQEVEFLDWIYGNGVKIIQPHLQQQEVS